MRNRVLLVLSAMLVAMLPAIQSAHSATQTYDGIVSDSMCGSKHMMPGKSAAECTQECVKAGSSYVLVSGAKVYSLSASPQKLTAFAGKHVLVQGTLAANKIVVSSILEPKP